MNPLLYVPANPSAMLKKDLAAAGIPFETEEGRLDFHAPRTAYINFLIDVGAHPKTMQTLARHATLEMTMNVYGRAREDRNRAVVEALGEMLTVPKRRMPDSRRRTMGSKITKYRQHAPTSRAC